MADETKADPAALRAFSEDMRVRVAHTRDSLADYRLAVAAFNAAPKEEVDHTIADRSGVIGADLDWLALVDAQPALFADALEAADRTAFPLGSFGDGLYEAAVHHQFLGRLAVEDPDAHAAAVAEPATARTMDPATGIQRMLLPYQVPEAWQKGVAIGDQTRARWDRRSVQVRGFFARMGGRFQAVGAFVEHGWRSTEFREARERLARTKEVFRQRLADANRRFGRATERIRVPHGRLARLGRLGRAIPLVGIGTNLAIATNSPYDGTRGTIDQVVAGATAVAGMALLAFSSPAVVAVAGAGVVVGTAWVVGNLAADAWRNRQESARQVGNGSW